MALNGTETVAYATATGSVVSIGSATTQAIALLARAIPAPVVTPVANVSGTTLSAAAIVGMTITRTGPTANFTDTLDTAANIIAALPTGSIASTAWTLVIRNLTAFSQTLAAGTGITLGGETVLPPNSTGLFLVQYVGAGAVTVTGVCIVPITMGALEANTAISTAGNGTLTAAALVGGVITRSGPTASFSDAVDSAANIVAALPNPNVGQSWECSVVNTTAYPQTITAGTGITLAGLGGGTTVPANSTGRFLVTYTGAGAVSLRLISVSYDAASGANPATATTFFGSGTGAFLDAGTLYRSVVGAGSNPGNTGGDYVLAVVSIPASSFDGVGNRAVTVTARGSFAGNTNNKRLKLIANPSAAVVGSTVTGGTTISDTGTLTTNGGGWWLSADIVKYGAAGSNTQIALSNGKIAGATHLGVDAPAPLTATESGTILVAVTGNAATAATDIVFNDFAVTAAD